TIADIRDAERLYTTVQAFRPAVIFHLAAQSLVRQSYEHPVATYATNVMGTVHILEAARRSAMQAVVNVTSDKCYENLESGQPYKETDVLGGGDPYSSSKACSELVTIAYRNSFARSANAPAIASVRAGNVIGGGDWAAE